MATATGSGLGGNDPGGNYTVRGYDEVYDPLGWLDEYLNPEGPSTAQSSHSGTTPAPDANGTKDPAATDSTSGGGYGYGGGGGGTASSGLSQYIQFYRINFFPKGKPPQGLLKKATDNGWTTEYFAQQVRMHDPAYYKSLEARKLLPGFNRTMKLLFPGLSDAATQKKLMQTPFYKNTAMWYLKNGIGTMGEAGSELLYSRITSTRRWKANNPEYRLYAKNPAASLEANPVLYKQLEQGMKDIFSEQNLSLPDDYYKSFFKSRYATETGLTALSNNLKTLSAYAPSASWFGQEVTGEQAKQVLFGGEQQGDLRSRLSRQFAVQASFTGSDQRGFDTTMSQREKLVRPTL